MQQSHVLEVITSEKVEQRVRAAVLQEVTQPELTLRSLNIVHKKNAQVLIIAQVSTIVAEETGVLERAVQRISLDPKVTFSRWWETSSDIG